MRAAKKGSVITPFIHAQPFIFLIALYTSIHFLRNIAVRLGLFCKVKIAEIIKGAFDLPDVFRLVAPLVTDCSADKSGNF